MPALPSSLLLAPVVAGGAAGCLGWAMLDAAERRFGLLLRPFCFSTERYLREAGTTGRQYNTVSSRTELGRAHALVVFRRAACVSIAGSARSGPLPSAGSGSVRYHVPPHPAQLLCAQVVQILPGVDTAAVQVVKRQPVTSEPCRFANRGSKTEGHT